MVLNSNIYIVHFKKDFNNVKSFVNTIELSSSSILFFFKSDTSEIEPLIIDMVLFEVPFIFYETLLKFIFQNVMRSILI